MKPTYLDAGKLAWYGSNENVLDLGSTLLRPNDPRCLHHIHWRQGIHAQAEGAARHLTPTVFMIP